MKISLIDYTGAGHAEPARHAAALLIFAKNTRVKMEATGLDEIIYEWSAAERAAELDYIADTIPGSWEFVDYTFLMQGVTRAFTHQLVRTRTASFAQQTMQVLDVNGWTYETGGTIAGNPDREPIYQNAMQKIDDAYRALIADGAKIEDARGLLPTNIHTNIVAKMNLRTVVGILQSRLSPRNLGEFRDVAAAMRDLILGVHPWATAFVDRTFDHAARRLDEMIDDPTADRIVMHKLVDQLRRKSAP